MLYVCIYASFSMVDIFQHILRFPLQVRRVLNEHLDNDSKHQRTMSDSTSSGQSFGHCQIYLLLVQMYVRPPPSARLPM